MTGKQPKTMAASDSEAAIDAFIRRKGVTRCPTACATPTQGSVPTADRAALRRYQATREELRQKKLAGRLPMFGGFTAR